METLLKNIIDRAQDEGFVFEAVKDQNGMKGVSLSFKADGGMEHYFILGDKIFGNKRYQNVIFDRFIRKIFATPHEKVCFDMRDMLKLGYGLSTFCNVIDISLLYGESRLYTIINKIVKDNEISEFLEKKNKYESHVRAAKTAKIDLDENSLLNIIPSKTIISFYKLRNEMVNILMERAPDAEWFRDVGYNRARVLYEMEEHGVKIDVDLILRTYDTTTSVADKGFLDHIVSKVTDEGFCYTKFAPQKSKTGRVQVAKGSLKCMNIPKSTVRRSIKSRFGGGKIAVLDFNAADYRCIVAAVDDEELNHCYDQCEDFHSRTVEAIFSVDKKFSETRRRVIKSITYMSLYGGSVENVAKTTGLKPSVVNSILEKLSFMKPINGFRDELHRVSINQGYVTTPSGMKIHLNGSEHPGKVLALYAQTCTNDAFMDGLVNVHDFLSNKRSCILFTVHDELVIDMAHDELDLLGEIKDMMELGSAKLFGTRLKVKATKGNNYWDQE